MSDVANTQHIDADSKKAADYDCVLIDDDDLVRFTWRVAAERQGKRLLALGRCEDFWRQATPFDRSIAIYIDYSLSDRPGGTPWIEQFRNAGFKNLYVETGYDETEIEPSIRSLLKGIVGKSPPWAASALAVPDVPNGKQVRP